MRWQAALRRPTGLRIGVIKNWDSRWYAKKGEFGDTLVEDYKLRKYLLETLSGAGVPKVEIERDAKRVRINIHCAKPGMVIGKQGAEIEKLRALCAKKLGKELNEVYINKQAAERYAAVQHSKLHERSAFRARKYCCGSR